MKFNNIARKAGICLVIAVSLVAAQQKHHFSPREKRILMRDFAGDSGVRQSRPRNRSNRRHNRRQWDDHGAIHPDGSDRVAARFGGRQYTGHNLDTSFCRGVCIPNSQEQRLHGLHRLRRCHRHGNCFSSISRARILGGDHHLRWPGTAPINMYSRPQVPTGSSIPRATNTIGDLRIAQPDLA